MPRAPRKCPKPGCENRITGTAYCPDHTTHNWVSGGPSRTSTPEHRAFRAAVLRRDDYTCRQCGHHDRTGRTLQADEIIPASQGGAPTIGNGQALCIPCHKIKIQREAAAGRARGKRTPTLPF
ncbi:HNH endonuclease [Nocardia sp. CC227C]|uniref:HNH endonuclease n=1 Tax=Nocardia sp. CC227C TaxID=3044562 RepID=UPI00278C3BBA|nr:HNH endonuclease signature motif containing protein [Nocardia sp. CC227C]